MAVFKCKMCGGTVMLEPGTSVGICEYCGTRQTVIVPKAEPIKKVATISLSSDVQRLLEKCKTDPFRATRYARLILEIDPNNREAKKILGI